MFEFFLMHATDPISEIPWFVIYTVVLMTLAFLLLLILVLVLAYKLNRVLIKMDDISQNAGRFVQLGMNFFKGSSKR